MSSLKKKFNYAVRRALMRVGVDVYPADYRNSVQAFLQYLMDEKGISSIWDVGANSGQYAEMLRNIGFKGTILSFEPIPAAWEMLNEKANADARWAIWDRVAIAAMAGEASLSVTEDSVSSSLLEPLDKDTVCESIVVKTETLASVIDRVNPVGASLLKIDCQGSEFDILRSAHPRLCVFDYIQIEASIYPFYEAERGVCDIADLMSSQGYSIAFVFPGVVDSQERMAQVEIFFKRD